MMVSYCLLKGLEPTYTHHEFMEKLGYGHLDPDEEWEKHSSQKISASQADGKFAV